MPEIVAVRPEQGKDGQHEHVGLLGYHSDHLKSEPIMVPPQRIIDKEALGEKFWVTIDGERTDLVVGKCPVCSIEPYLRTAADSGDTERLLELPPG
ncbi:MAG: hypothetical protein ABR548_09455 [Actinomycetota bacterium]|nr:hypothetical protein [Actinomycetota bacterium]